ncbi:hypothetical protein [uncultured Duncaniella sp.]|uniref:hypothetical protein n=1 Tax=uncultured Duncaniella sp. TaxID=2768039 RepID=UPI0025A96B9E|nr:hypothetical protein [uncultured Duncaniella sp.]
MKQRKPKFSVLRNEEDIPCGLGKQDFTTFIQSVIPTRNAHRERQVFTGVPVAILQGKELGLRNGSNFEVATDDTNVPPVNL